MRNRHPRSRNRRGVIVVLFSVLLVVLVVILAFSIDVGYMYSVRTDLQRAVDAGALAAAGQLTNEPNKAEKTAKEYVVSNSIGATKLSPKDIQVELGQWESSSRSFQAGLEPFDTVRVVGQRAGAPTFFAGLLGRRRFDSSAEAIATISPRDILLVLDYSGSMNTDKKIDALKDSVILFLNYLEENAAGIDRVGVVIYSTTGELVMPLTFDLDGVRSAVRARPADGFTNIGEGMQLGREELERNARPNASQLMVLMTDGLANRPTTRDPKAYVKQEARLAESLRMPMATISFAAGADKQLMAEVARITDGVHFHVQGKPSAQKKELRDVFLQIAKSRPAQLVE